MPDDTKTFYEQSDLPLADRDAVVEQILDHGVKVHRKILAGTRVPPDLIEAYEASSTPAKAPAKTSSAKTADK